MILFLDGPDGAGKSTLAAKLISENGWKLKSFSYPRTEAEKLGMFDMYKEFIYANREDLIVDRCWYSDMVYGPIFRNETSITPAQMYELEDMVMKNGGGAIIHCTAPDHVLFERVNVRGDDYIDPTDDKVLHTIKYSYELLMHEVSHRIPVVRYEYNKDLQEL